MSSRPPVQYGRRSSARKQRKDQSNAHAQADSGMSPDRASPSARTPAAKPKAPKRSYGATERDLSGSETESSRSSRKQKRSRKESTSPERAIAVGGPVTPVKPIPKASTSKIPPFSSGDTTMSSSPATGSQSSSKHSMHPASSPMTPKDLSSLFPQHSRFVKEPNKSPTKGGLAKKMLSRSRTEPSLTASQDSAPASPHRTPTPTINRTSSLPVLVDETPIPPLASTFEASAPQLTTRPPLRTYAKSRSFLVALPDSSSIGDVKRPHDSDLETELRRESYTDLRARWGVDDSDDPQADNAPLNDLKSITEMRSKGEIRRFYDEVGYLFEGLEPQTAISLRQTSALEIVVKMCESEFMRQARAAGFISRTWEAFRGAGAGSGDKVLDPVLALFVTLASRDERDADELSRATGFQEALLKLLSVEKEKDPLGMPAVNETETEWSRRLGVGKTERVKLSTLKGVLSTKIDFLSASIPASIRGLASRTLASLPPMSLPDPLTLQPVLLPTILAELKLVASRVACYQSGLSFLPLSLHEAPNFEHLDHCLRILETLWFKEQAPSQLELKDKIQSLTEGFVALIVGGEVLLRDEDIDDELLNIVSKCLENTLRVLVNLTHNGPEWCRVVLDRPLALPCILRIIVTAQRDMEEDNSDEEDADNPGSGRPFDRLCLALAILTNLVQEDNRAKDMVRTTALSETCPGQRGCITGCQCLSKSSALQYLVKMYGSQIIRQDHSMAEVEANFLRGHTAVLVGLLCCDNPKNQRIVSDALSKKSKEAGLDALITTVRDFSGLYADVTGRIAQMDEEHGQLITKDLQKGSQRTLVIANEILGTLETMRH